MGMRVNAELPLPADLKNEYPLSDKLKAIKAKRDEEIRDIFTGKSDKFVVIIGPCSADNEDSVCEYVNRLAKLNDRVSDKLMIIPRIYTNKPRTTGEGYKGMLHQPDPEQAPDLLAGIIAEAGSFLEGRLDDPYQTSLQIRKDTSPVCGQLIRLHLEELLLSLYRRNQNSLLTGEVSRIPLSDRTLSKNTDAELFSHIKNYLLSHLADHLTIEQICHDNLISRSRLQKLFRDSEGTGVIEYYSALKISEAKSMIRSGQMNFTQISEYLGYSSIHYFSRQFKRSTGMTPSEYVSSIRALADEGHKKA